MAFDTPAYLLYWLLILAPALPYAVLNLSYRRILSRKIDEAAARLTEDTKKAYAKAYGDPSVRQSLQQFYHWRTYVAPLALTSIIASVFTAVALAIVGLPLPGLPETLVTKMATTPVAVIGGAFGAYLFGLDDLVRRHATADLSSSALHTTWVRVSISAGIGAILHGMSTPQAVAVPVAFAVGTLPLSSIWAFIRERANLRTDEGRFWEPDLYRLQGLTKPARDRLVQEEIDSVQRLACSDPVRLLFRTNIEWNVILDLIDQALLVNFVGDKIVALRELGIRGAIEMADLYERSPELDNTADEVAHAPVMLALVGTALGSNADAARNLAYVLSNDALVQFVWEHYDSVYSETDSAKDAPPTGSSWANLLPRFQPSAASGTEVAPPPS